VPSEIERYLRHQLKTLSHRNDFCDCEKTGRRLKVNEIGIEAAALIKMNIIQNESIV
jgi:hypothetical protein